MALINYEIPDDIHKRAKAAAALDGVSLKEFVIRALEKAANERLPKGTK